MESVSQVSVKCVCVCVSKGWGGAKSSNVFAVCLSKHIPKSSKTLGNIVKQAETMRRNGERGNIESHHYEQAGMKRGEDTEARFWFEWEMTGTVAKLQPQIGKMVNEQVKKKRKKSTLRWETWWVRSGELLGGWALISSCLMPCMAKAC